ncbi:MAG: riboflavin synthase [Clostridiaceae bacterium]|nr:riboflavin synthase [Clostridiaceae bacterium]
MFTGIIEEVGVIRSITRGNKSAVLTVEASKVLDGSKIGDSIAVNGVCLTATSISATQFCADVMPETLRRSSLGSLSRGSLVNLERAMAADGRFGGHIVSGHIDGTGQIAVCRPEDTAVWVEIKTPPEILKYIVQKGSVAIDGISLTVAALSDTGFAVSLIPHTGSETALLQKKPGDVVNLENDIVGKYVERLLQFGKGKEEMRAGAPFPAGQGTTGITMEFLAENGF